MEKHYLLSESVRQAVLQYIAKSRSDFNFGEINQVVKTLVELKEYNGNDVAEPNFDAMETSDGHPVETHQQ